MIARCNPVTALTDGGHLAENSDSLRHGFQLFGDGAREFGISLGATNLDTIRKHARLDGDTSQGHRARAPDRVFCGEIAPPGRIAIRFDLWIARVDSILPFIPQINDIAHVLYSSCHIPAAVPLGLNQVRNHITSARNCNGHVTEPQESLKNGGILKATNLYRADDGWERSPLTPAQSDGLSHSRCSEVSDAD